MKAKFDSVFFWATHPNLYIAMYVAYDYQKLSTEEFIFKYLDIIENDERNEQTTQDLINIVYPLYYELTGRNYDTNLIAL